ncbi:PQ loop repeat-domain-containing protein [Coniochaeta sp. 2T2.1]|nr:PQ loop repeat-domain-containing protein [Coniochaeta sp. 2T2.1]
MAPPTAPLNLDVEAISGICGSISIACWVVVFTPQIVENFRRGAADGLSLQFIIVWLAGDIFNILGAVLQHVLPTMIILAIYYTIADIVLLAQCFYYRGFTWRDEVIPPPKKSRRNGDAVADERTGLLSDSTVPTVTINGEAQNGSRRGSGELAWEHLSPAMPLLSDVLPPRPAPPPPTRLQTAAFNSLAMLMVIGAGVGGWALSRGYSKDSSTPPPADGNDDGGLVMDFWGQIFGWLCAVLYLGSRLPQLLLNFRRKSTDGVSMLFFLFACLGNLTYVMSIFAYEPKCEIPGQCEPGEAGAIYGRYMLVNLSWLVGSAGTLFLDMAIFVQFFIYNRDDDSDSSSDTTVDEEEQSIAGEDWDPRPVLQRDDSDYAT